MRKIALINPIKQTIVIANENVQERSFTRPVLKHIRMVLNDSKLIELKKHAVLNKAFGKSNKRR